MAKKERTESHEKLIQEAKSLRWSGFYTMSEESLAKKLQDNTVIKPVDLPKSGKSKKELKREKKVYETRYKAKRLRDGLGERDPRFLEFVMAYRDIIPDEYNSVAHIIEELML